MDNSNKIIDINSWINKLSSLGTLQEFCTKFIWDVAKHFEASQGAFFITKMEDDARYLEFLAGYAYHIPDSETIRFEFGEGLSGQVAKSGQKININNVPEGYISILSGLGSSSPNSIIIFPITSDGKVIAVFELASFLPFKLEDENFLNEISNKVSAFIVKLLH